MKTPTNPAYAADDAYSAELRRVFGKAAGDARYDSKRNESSPELRRLAAAAKLAAEQADRARATWAIAGDAREAAAANPEAYWR